MQPTRRELLLAAPFLLSRADAEVTPEVMKFRPEIEPLVALIERTPREKCAEMAVGQLRQGVSYRQFLAALFLAGVRNINPRPPGFALHCVFVVHSAHLMSLEAPPDARLLPLFYVLDDFKASQERDAKAKDGDYTMRDLRGSLPSADRAPAELTAAMEAWDMERAERAVAALARSRAADEVFAMLWRYGARDYRNIGHKAIFVANTYRTLQAIGWQHAEPVLRSLVLGLLDFKRDQKVNGYALDDQVYDANMKRVKETAVTSNETNPDATRAILRAIREGTPDAACAEVASMLNKGKTSPAAVWDAVHLAAAEVRLRASGGSALASIHTVTSTNALHYAWQSAPDARSRTLLMLQAVGWVGQFRTVAEMRPETMRKRVITDLEPAKGTLEETLAAIPAKTDEAAARVFAMASNPQERRAWLAAAMRQTLSKANEVHYYKYLAALIEDVPLVSPEWQPHLLATTAYYVKGAGDPEPMWMKRAREAGAV
jgi:hypothetical protein